MNKTFLIFRHEFINTVKRPGFTILTFTVPLLVLIAIGIGRIKTDVSGKAVTEIQSIGYVDETGQLDDYQDQGIVQLVPFGSVEEARQALIDHDVNEYIVISENSLGSGVIDRFLLEKQIEAPAYITAAIKNFISSNLLSEKVSPEIIRIVETPFVVHNTKLTETGRIDTEQGGAGAIIVPAVFALLLAISIQFTSSYLLKGFGEEKESRLIEVLISSVSVGQLLKGKVLGLGAVGLLQVLVWLLCAPLLVSLLSDSAYYFVRSIQLPPNFILFGIIYFILGYLFFAVLSISVGAISPNATEGQQLSLIYTLIGYVPLWLMSLLMVFPDSPVWVILSLFPVTAPAQVILRLGMVDIPLWEIIASIGIMVLSIIGVLNLSIRIFRVHFLLHGRRPKLREVVNRLHDH